MRITVAPRTVAACAAVGIALATTAGTAPIAFAQAPLSAANIDATQSGSITINKRLNPTGTLSEGTGQPVTNAPGEPLGGITFKITKLKGDITTNEGFAALSQMTAEQAKQPANQDTTTVRTPTTGADGSVTEANLPLGAYLVEEQPSAANPDLVPASAFIVFVPMTVPGSNGQWNYNPVVYPKNTSLSTEKTVVDSEGTKGDNVGDVVNYTIKSTVPTVPQGQTLGQYQIHDRFNPTELRDVTVKSVKVVDAANEANVLETLAASEYTVNDSTMADGRTERTVSVNETSLSKLSAHPGAKVVVELDATLLALGESGDGVIVNETQTTGFTREGGVEHGFRTNEDEVTTYLAKLKVLKHAEGDVARTLKGAEFQLYQTANCTAAGDKGDALTVDGTSTWTTGNDGTLTIDGLHVTDFANNADATLDNYCLVETKAPTGYELLTNPIAVTFSRADLTREAQVAPLKSVNVANTQSTTPRLPSTGGMGVTLLLLLGAGIIGGGVYAARRNSAQA